jgi:hypothetical protein
MSYKIILNNSEEFIADNINESVENRDGNYLSALSLNFSKKADGITYYTLSELEEKFTSISNLSHIVIKDELDAIVLDSTEYQLFRSIYKYFNGNLINICLLKSQVANEVTDLQRQLAETNAQLETTNQAVIELSMLIGGV